jgi:hypothetical protein
MHVFDFFLGTLCISLIYLQGAWRWFGLFFLSLYLKRPCHAWHNGMGKGKQIKKQETVFHAFQGLFIMETDENVSVYLISYL